jgi:hypothetical protein
MQARGCCETGSSFVLVLEKARHRPLSQDFDEPGVIPTSIGMCGLP